MRSTSTLERRPARASRARRLLAALVVVAVGAAVGPVTAEDDIDDLRREREAKRREAAEVASQVDALAAEDDDLVQALDDLDSFITAQQAQVEAAVEAIEAAEADALARRGEAETLAADMEAIKVELRDRAVDAFVQPSRSGADQLTAGDLNEDALRRFLLDEVVRDEFDVIDDLRTAAARKAAAEEAALDAAAQAEELRRERQAGLDELEDARVEAEELRAEVQRRIGVLEAEAAEIEAADRAIESEIRELEAEARRRAEELARRQAEDEARRRAEEIAQAGDDTEAQSSDDTDTETTTEGEDGGEVAPPATGDFVLTVRPVPGRVTSSFGRRVHPIFGTVRMHNGLDMNGSTGEPIAAGAAGTVISAGSRSGYGNTVVLSHGNGFTTLYAHMSAISVSDGASVSAGDRIGLVGSTGWSTGPHLHLEVRIDGVAVDPRPFLP